MAKLFSLSFIFLSTLFYTTVKPENVNSMSDIYDLDGNSKSLNEYFPRQIIAFQNVGN